MECGPTSQSGGQPGASLTNIASRTRQSLSSSSLLSLERAQSLENGDEPSSKSLPSSLDNNEFLKRKRDETTKWAYVVCFDEPSRPVLVDKTLFSSVACRTASLLSHQTPDCNIDGIDGWRTTVSRAIFVAFIKSIVHREFIVCRDLDYAEVVRFFEYEGLSVPGSKTVDDSGGPGAGGYLSASTMSIGFFKPASRPSETVKHISSLVANALLEWPRIAAGILGAAHDDNEKAINFTCSSSRAWVCFAERPTIELSGGDEIYHLARKRPKWLLSTLSSIGVVHFKLCARTSLDSSQRDERSFTQLARLGVETDSAYNFLSVKRDMSQEQRSSNSELLRYADKWANAVLSATTDFGELKTERVMPAAVKYARASVSMAERLVRGSPVCSRIFNGACSDSADTTHTPERAILEKMLKSRGIKVVRWYIEARTQCRPFVPICFPPSFVQKEGNSGPCVLLDFEKAWK